MSISLSDELKDERSDGTEDCVEQLPVHFFTIVLNGQPFIEYHIDIFQQLSFEWHWHIIEGVAAIKHCDSWSLKNGGHITDEMHFEGRSNDGTSEYLDKLSQQYPNKITIYRKPKNVFWDGRIEMVSAPIPNIKQECLLWQIDVDELWTAEQIRTSRRLFLENPYKTAAYYWCHFFVGRNLVVSTRNCYSQNPNYEWLRTWRFKPGAAWKSHSPPRLFTKEEDGESKNIAEINPFLHEETEQNGLIFQHFAYVMPPQLTFKEHCYGYKDALKGWKLLQEETNFPVKLSKYLSWVEDDTLVDSAEVCGVVPIAQKDTVLNSWFFVKNPIVKDAYSQEAVSIPKIAVDCVSFQTANKEQAEFWNLALQFWADNDLSKHFLLIDRAGTSPRLQNLHYCSVPLFNESKIGIDSKRIQKLCEQNSVSLFVSTGISIPTRTPSVKIIQSENINFEALDKERYSLLHASWIVSLSKVGLNKIKTYFPELSFKVSKSIELDLQEEKISQIHQLTNTVLSLAEEAKHESFPKSNFLWEEVADLKAQIESSSQTNCLELQYELKKQKKIIASIKTSSFWQLRSLWMKTKSLFGRSSKDWWE
ncbi:hypothetical protein [Sphaerothrix gracilis]|uniref:hypothetical protein n=1 Tax=Sphaerothrix gracilis TaxID=3151835 RepID=UPI0031FDD9DD